MDEQPRVKVTLKSGCNYAFAICEESGEVWQVSINDENVADEDPIIVNSSAADIAIAKMNEGHEGWIELPEAMFLEHVPARIIHFMDLNEMMWLFEMLLDEKFEQKQKLEALQTLSELMKYAELRGEFCNTIFALPDPTSGRSLESVMRLLSICDKLDKSLVAFFQKLEQHLLTKDE